MYLGFYQNLMSPGAIILMTIFAFINWILLKISLRDFNGLRGYLSFDNINTFIVITISGYALGGIFAFNS